MVSHTVSKYIITELCVRDIALASMLVSITDIELENLN